MGSCLYFVNIEVRFIVYILHIFNYGLDQENSRSKCAMCIKLSNQLFKSKSSALICIFLTSLPKVYLASEILKPQTYFLVSHIIMDGYNNSETFMSDLNTLIYGHKMEMAGLFAKQDVVSKLLHEQITLCDSLAVSINNCQSLESGVQDLMEAMAKRKYYEEKLKKITKLHMQEKHGVQG